MMTLRKVRAASGTSSIAAVAPAPRRNGHMFAHIATWPPLVYIILGVALGLIWALGTSVQVLTSEAWMMGKPMRQIDFTAFGQLWQAVTGHLPADMLVPFMFGWGV